MTSKPGTAVSMITCFENIVPGDVIFYTGHIMMVQSVGVPDSYDGKLEPYWNDGSKVHIIESVYHGTNGCFGVVIHRTLNHLNVNGNEWKIWRQK